MMNRDKKEMFCYLAIFIILLVIVVLNNVFWKLGKNTGDTTNNTEYLKYIMYRMKRGYLIRRGV